MGGVDPMTGADVIEHGRARGRIHRSHREGAHEPMERPGSCRVVEALSIRPSDHAAHDADGPTSWARPAHFVHIIEKISIAYIISLDNVISPPARNVISMEMSDDTVRPKPRSGRGLILAVVAIAAVLIIATAMAYMLGAFDSPSSGGDGSNDGGIGGDGGSLSQAFDLNDGDFIEYSIFDAEGLTDGTMRLTFLNVTIEKYDVRMEQTVDGQVFTFSWESDANDTLGTTPDLEDPEEFGELIGEETVDTVFGPRNVLHYRVVEGSMVIDYYVGKDLPILYRAVTDDDNATVTIELVDTNIERIINANA
jgi:hypothetical protein